MGICGTTKLVLPCGCAFLATFAIGEPRETSGAGAVWPIPEGWPMPSRRKKTPNTHRITRAGTSDTRTQLRLGTAVPYVTVRTVGGLHQENNRLAIRKRAETSSEGGALEVRGLEAGRLEARGLEGGARTGC